MPYRLLCLDAGFTLLSPRRSLADALTAVLAEHGHAVDPADVRRAWDVADRWFWDEYHRPDNRTWGDDAEIERTWRAYHALMLNELGVPDEAHDLVEAILEGQRAADAWELYPDVEPALARLRAEVPDLAMAVISDWSSNLDGILSGLGLDHYLDFTLASGAVGVAKPDPAIFLLALERAGVEPSAALMVGDSLRADVMGAAAAGIRGVLLARPRDDADHASPPDDVPSGVTVIGSLVDLVPLVTSGDPRARGRAPERRRAARRMA